MRRIGCALASLCLLTGPLAAGAATLGTPVTFESGDVLINCRVTNLGRKPVTIQQVTILGNAPGAGELDVDGCTSAPRWFPTAPAASPAPRPPGTSARGWR